MTAMTIDQRIDRLKRTIPQARARKKRKQIVRTFKYKQFSAKQIKVLTWWTDVSPYHDADGVIADGSIRSGKTMSMSLSYVMWAMETFDGENFIMAGKTIGSFRRNVVTPLKIMLRSRGYEVEDNRADNILMIFKGSRFNYFHIFGGKDEGSQDLVQGLTAAGAFFDEVALMPESFVNQATGRCSVDGSKLWFNCNPDGPMHWFKRNWIDKNIFGLSDEEIERRKAQGEELKNLLYLHFTMDDNLSLSEKIKARYRSWYTGVFYLRYIRGLWAVAEGLIYTSFTDDNLYDDEDAPAWLKSTAARTITIDYGTHNPCVYLDVWDDGETVWIDNEYRWDSTSDIARRRADPQKTDAEYADDLQAFMGDRPDQQCMVVVDPSAASFITELRGRGVYVKPADNTVEDGIRAVSSMFALRKIRVHRDRCQGLRTELLSYVWDDKAAERGEDKPVKQRDHGPDALRYYVYTVLPSWRTGKRA